MTGGVQSAMQNRVGAMVGPLQGWDDPAEVHPDEGLTGGRWQLVRQLLVRIVFAWQRKSRSFFVF